MIRNWCCSFIMCSYETVFWLPSFCLVLWRWGWPVNDWNVFLLPLVYLWDCILQHGGSGKKRTSSSWSMQPLRPLNSTYPETIPFDQRLGRRIFRQWISGKATFDCSSSSQVWVCKHLTLAKVVQHLRLSRRNRPAQFFCSNLAELFVQTGV